MDCTKTADELDAASAAQRLDAFRERVDRHFDRDRIDSFWDFVPDLQTLIGSGALREHLRQQLKGLIDSPNTMGQWGANQVKVLSGRGFALSIFLFEKPRDFIHTSSCYSMFAPLGDRPLQIDRYRLPAHYRNEVFDPSVQLQFIGLDAIGPGQVLQTGHDDVVCDFSGGGPVPLVKFSTASYQALEWLFNKDTRLAAQANDADLVWTQLRVAANLLGRLGRTSAVPTLKQLSQHPHHSVRWAAIRNLALLDATAGRERLQRALDDAHPHIRKAASTSLAPRTAASVPGTETHGS